MKENEWEHFNKTNSNVPNHMVRDIEVDEKGNIWMATNNGLIKISDYKIEPIFFREGGMGENTIMDIAIDQNTV